MLFELDLTSAKCLFLALFIPIVVIVLALLRIEDGVIPTLLAEVNVRRIFIPRELK